MDTDLLLELMPVPAHGFLPRWNAPGLCSECNQPERGAHVRPSEGSGR